MKPIFLQKPLRNIPKLFLKASASQHMAGNYKKAHRRWMGLDITIENEAGTVRTGVNADGTAWATPMLNDYGYIRRTIGSDGEHIDCFFGPDPAAKYVYIVHQRKHGQWYTYDEDKALIGFTSKRDALVCYLSHYDDPRFLGEISVLPAAEFKRRALETPRKTKYERKLEAL